MSNQAQVGLKSPASSFKESTHPGSVTFDGIGEQRIEWLRGVVSALGQPRLGTEKHLFIKFDAWKVLDLPLIRRAFPAVPWIFLYRDPVEVLTSQPGHGFNQVSTFVRHLLAFGSFAGETSTPAGLPHWGPRTPALPATAL